MELLPIFEVEDYKGKCYGEVRQLPNGENAYLLIDQRVYMVFALKNLS